MNTALGRNAFRCLSLSADAELKEIYRRQKKLEIALEMGDSDIDDGVRFLPFPNVSREDVIEAVHRLETDSTRVREELFWVHDLQGKIDLSSDNTDALLTNLRSLSDVNTTKGAIAQHNTAVVLTSLAIKSNGGKRLDYWKDALKYWDATNRNPIFWQFLEDRYPVLDHDSAPAIPLKEEVGAALAQAIAEEIWDSIPQRDFRRIASIILGVSAHGSWLPIREELVKIGRQLAAEFTARAGAIIDRISTLQKDGDKQLARRTLTDAERDFRVLTQETDPVFECLGTADAVGWPDTKASLLRQFSLAHFNLLDDSDQALKFIVEATQLAKGTEIRSRLDADWRHVQQSIFCSEALALLANGKYIEAEQKLSAAMPLATEEQKQEIADLQQTCRRARVFTGVDRTKTSPTLSTINGIGATFYGRRDYDLETKSYVTTHWFTFIFLPIVPLGAYRVSDAGSNSYNIYGRVPLSPFLKKYRWGTLGLLALLLIWGSVNSTSSSSSADSPSPSVSMSERSSGSGRYAPEPQATGYQEAAGIESEREELKLESARLDTEKQELDTESAALADIKTYAQSVESNYTADNIPDSVRDRYSSSIDDYNRRLPAFKKSLRAYNEAVESFESRRRTFNARVQRYNASR